MKTLSIDPLADMAVVREGKSIERIASSSFDPDGFLHQFKDELSAASAAHERLRGVGWAAPVGRADVPRRVAEIAVPKAVRTYS